jgi:hypothetical protein
MAHIDLAEGTGGPRPSLRDGSGYPNIQHTARSIARMKDEGRRMKAEDSQETMSRELHSKKVDREPWTVLTTDNLSGAPTQKPPGQTSVQMLEFLRKSLI